MKTLLSICIFLSSFSVLATETKVSSDKMMITEQIVLKVSDQVYSLSDLRNYFRVVQIFRCLEPFNILFGVIGLDQASSHEIPEELLTPTRSYIDLERHSFVFEAIARFLVMKSFFSTYHYQMKSISFDNKKCKTPKNGEKKYLQLLYDIEQLLSERFGFNEYDQKRIARQIRIQHPTKRPLELKKLIQAEIRDKVRKNAETFVRSIQSKYKIKFYY